MAPAKRSKSVNKGFAAAAAAGSDSSPSKDDKSKHKKRKLSNMLGPQWSKYELERFYEAYRKYGSDWKKVASVVRSRSIEMVEALYNMNRAYLSLPEGTASVVGLIAMMTDHYNVMEGSGSEKDNDEPSVLARKLQKYPKAKGRLDIPRADSSQRSIGSSDRCLSLLKLRQDGKPSVPVRKRTPRVPVACLDIHPDKRSRGSVLNANKDEVSRGALLLTEARQTLSSSHVSPATYREFEHLKASHGLTRERVNSQFPAGKRKYSRTIVDEESAEGSFGSNEAKNGDLFRSSMDSGKSALGEYKKGKKKGKREQVEQPEAKLFDDFRKACNFPDREHRGKFISEGASAKFDGSPSEGQRKRNKTFEDESELAACDALQTLAEMSLMMPYITDEPVEDAGDSIRGRDTGVNLNTHSDVTLNDKSANKKKRKSQASKVKRAEELAKKETLTDEEVKSADSSGQISTVSKRCKSVMSPDVSSSNDRQMGEAEVAVSSTQVHSASQVVYPIRRKNSRKRDRSLLQKDRICAQSTCSSESSSLLQDGMQCVKEKVSHCLSWHDVRRWCVYEWFYSAIDYPWFAKREFVEYLNHVKLGHIPRLTRVEWSVIRSSLGKPRRFSERFLQEEREKLKQYRESVRTHYANLRAGLGEGLPTDLARPLSVGQQVIAIHPKSREFHNGSVLTVDRHNCLVQFDRQDLGVESVMDIDCMPLNPVENMPEALRRQKMLLDYQNSQVRKVSGAYMLALGQSVANEMKVKPSCMSAHAKVTGSGNLRTASTTENHSCDMAQMQPKRSDMRAIPGLTHSLDRKGVEQHSTYPGNRPCWPQPVANSVGLLGRIRSSNNSTISCQETASNVVEIVEGSRGKAQKMVDIAIKTMALMKEGEDAFGRIGDALDATNKAKYATNCNVSTNRVPGNLPVQNSVTQSISEPQLPCDASAMKSAGDSAATDVQVPSDLIASCVATLLMIQTCTERQYPPGEVAQILDNAVTSLHPCCPQNLSLYREIQMCMGRIKTQILALIPT